MPFLARLLLAGVIIVGGIIVVETVVKNRRNSQRKRALNSAKEKPRNTNDILRKHPREEMPVGDKKILDALPQRFLTVFKENGIAVPERITGDWLTNDVFGIACMGDGPMFSQILNAIIENSRGQYISAARIGEEMDDNRMIPGREIAPGHKVVALEYQGLIRVIDNEVIVKAKIY